MRVDANRISIREIAPLLEFEELPSFITFRWFHMLSGLLFEGFRAVWSAEVCAIASTNKLDLSALFVKSRDTLGKHAGIGSNRRDL
jgi:hypothetical protein